MSEEAVVVYPKNVRVASRISTLAVLAFISLSIGAGVWAALQTFWDNGGSISSTPQAIVISVASGIVGFAFYLIGLGKVWRKFEKWCLEYLKDKDCPTVAVAFKELLKSGLNDEVKKEIQKYKKQVADLGEWIQTNFDNIKAIIEKLTSLLDKDKPESPVVIPQNTGPKPQAPAAVVQPAAPKQP